MAKLKIVTDEASLRKKSRPVTEINDRIKTLLSDMLETMREADGVGLAAPQVGVLRRAVVIEAEPGKALELINPEIIESSGSQIGFEGCLSFPGMHGTVERPSYVKLRALDPSGELRTYEGIGLAARAMCHEVEHLDGILYIDKATDITSDGEKREE